MQTVYNQTFQIIPLLMVAVVWYLIITSLLSLIQVRIECYYARGERGATQPGDGPVAIEAEFPTEKA